MHGSVIWESKSQREVWEGHVTRCVRQGQDINVVFDCRDLGEGQITFTDTVGKQLVTSRFLYFGQKEAPQVSVCGALSSRLGLIVFEGTWTDPIDGLGTWQFYLEVEGIASLVASTVQDTPDSVANATALTQLVAKLAPSSFTEEYGFDIAPTRSGIYRVRECSQKSQDAFQYSSWNGTGWSSPQRTIEQVLEQRMTVPTEKLGESFSKVRSWQGLTEAGWHSMVAQIQNRRANM